MLSELAAQIQVFRNNVIKAGVIDSEGTHHEFVSGMHGQKIDFDRIPHDNTLYNEWMDVNAAFIRSEFPELPRVIIGVANGTNQPAVDIASRLAGIRPIIGLASEKDSQNSKVLRLTRGTIAVLRSYQPESAIVVEDVGTTGSNSVQVALGVREAGVKNLEVVTTWNRREHLERLEEANVPYRAIINESLPTYSPEECVKTGFCSQDWKLIRRK